MQLNTGDTIWVQATITGHSDTHPNGGVSAVINEATDPTGLQAGVRFVAPANIVRDASGIPILDHSSPNNPVRVRGSVSHTVESVEHLTVGVNGLTREDLLARFRRLDGDVFDEEWGEECGR